MKRIVNALLLLVFLSSVSGCASIFPWGKSEKPIEFVTTPVDKPPLALTLPTPLKLPTIKWSIITKDNIDQTMSDIEKSGKDPVLFGLSDRGYQDLSIMFSEIRNFISSQQDIILKYQEYYEPTIKNK